MSEPTNYTASILLTSGTVSQDFLLDTLDSSNFARSEVCLLWLSEQDIVDLLNKIEGGVSRPDIQLERISQQISGIIMLADGRVILLTHYNIFVSSEEEIFETTSDVSDSIWKILVADYQRPRCNE